MVSTLTKNNNDGDKVTRDEANEILKTQEYSETSPTENKDEVCNGNEIKNVEPEENSLCEKPAALAETKKCDKIEQGKTRYILQKF